MKIIENIKKINAYILNPKHDVHLVTQKNKKWEILFSGLLYDLVVGLLIVFPLVNFIHYYIIRLESIHDDLKFGIGLMFFLTVILAPIFEEFFFRMPLRYQNNYLFIFFDGFLGDKSLEGFWKRNFSFFFYLFAFVFGVIHITNYENDQNIFFALSPIIIFSQSYGGLIMGYIRMHLGLKWSILHHALHNFFIVIILGLFIGNDTSISEKNENFQLKVTEITFYEDQEKKTAIFDKEKIYKIDWDNESFQKLMDTLYDKKYLVYDEQLIKVELQTKKPISKDHFLELIKKEYRIEPKK